MWSNRILVLIVQKEEKTNKKNRLSDKFLFFCLLSQMWEIVMSVEFLSLVTSAPTNDC